MLMHTDESSCLYLRLTEELRWLQEHHPEKMAMIGVAQHFIDTVRRAGSTESLTFKSPRGEGVQAWAQRLADEARAGGGS